MLLSCTSSEEYLYTLSAILLILSIATIRMLRSAPKVFLSRSGLGWEHPPGYHKNPALDGIVRAFKQHDFFNNVIVTATQKDDRLVYVTVLI